MLVVFILEGSNCPLLVLARKSLNLLPRMVDLCIVEKLGFSRWTCWASTFAELFYSGLNCLFEAQGSWTETPKKLLQDCPIKLKNAADKMSQATYSLTPAMDPYDILQVVKVLDSMIEEVSEAIWLTIPAVMKVMMKGKRKRFYNTWNDCIGAIDGIHIADIHRCKDVPTHNVMVQTMIVVATMAIHKFIRKHVYQNDVDFMEYENINRAYENIIDPENVHDGENDDDDDGCSESNNSSGFEMELTRDAIASDLTNSL
ncbi:hypothetical protein Gotur_029728 [Gossypium turneri]